MTTNSALTIGASTATAIGVLKTANIAGTGSSQDRSSKNTGDTVTISEEARKKAAQLASSSGKSTGSSATKADSASSDTTQQSIDTVKQQIKEVEEKIQKLQQSGLPEKQKQQLLMDLDNQLMQLNDQLAKLQTQSSGTTVVGGTAAKGFAKSLT